MSDIVIDLKKIDRLETLQEYAHIWKKLQAGSDMTCFQSYEWNELLYREWTGSAYQQLFCDLYLLIGKEEGAVRLLFPLLIQKRSTRTRWFGREKGIYILGHGSYSDYMNAIYDDCSEELFAALLQKIRISFKNINCIFTDLRTDTRFEHFLNQQTVKSMTESVSVSVSIDESSEIYQKRLSKHTRQNLRTARNRMHTDGLDYEFRIYGTIDDASLLDELRTLHMARLRVKLNGNSTANPVRRLSSFIRKTVREHRETHNNIIYSSMQCMDNSCLVVVFLNQKIAGYLYGLRDGSIIRIMQNCVDEQYHFYSPMFRGAYDFILSCYEKGNVSAVDFTRGDEEYKYKLGGVETKLRNYVISD